MLVCTLQCGCIKAQLFGFDIGIATVRASTLLRVGIATVRASTLLRVRDPSPPLVRLRGHQAVLDPSVKNVLVRGDDDDNGDDCDDDDDDV